MTLGAASGQQVQVIAGLSPGESATVDRTAPGGPADRAGLQTGDRIRGINDVRISTLADVRRALEKVKPGDKVSIEYHPLRDGSRGGELVAATLPDGRRLGSSATRPPPAK